MHNTSRNILAMLLALLMTASTLSGCLGSDDGPVEDESPDELEDWNVYLVQSISDLPACDSTKDGRLYYVSMTSGFQACSGGSWSSIDLTGPTGPAGADGADGADGAQGPAGSDGADGVDGAQGPAGPAGSDGTSFSIIGTVDETSDLGEIYIGDPGDGFLVNSTVHIHVWSGSEWIDLGDISGPQGVAGADGADGDDGAQGPPGPAGADGAQGSTGADGADGAPGSMPTVMEMVVTVSSMDFYVDGLQQPEVGLYRGFTYTFEQSASSNSPHPFRLSTTSDGTHGGGSQYTDGVTYTGTQGSNGLLTFTVPLDAPDTLYYYCQNHAGMGGTVEILSLGYVST
ncbi:MAG: hypothetical protein QGG21_02965 [Candidatus Thalassarchaeaceae archaeon]|nr:hypothetical protein [Candidatus Thalassarchaeaceae archaeon]